MRNKILFVALMIFMLSAQTATSNTPEGSLRKAVTEIIKQDVMNHLDTAQQEEASVSIQFIVNKDKQIRVVSVKSLDPEIKELVIDKLEKAKVDVDNVFTKFHYNLTINFIKRA
jgi:hypothetical protein